MDRRQRQTTPATVRTPDYWFPRDCPRAMAWTLPTTSQADADRILGPGGG
ncbi:DUF6886 family protein [Amycolatopsis suaedae]